MKKIFLSTLGIFALAAGAHAQLLYDGFNYTSGMNLIGNGVWAEDNTGTDATIASGNLNYTGLQTSSGNRIQMPGFVGDTRGAQTAFTSTGTVTDIYYSFLMRLDNVNSLSTTFTNFSRVESGATNGIGLDIRQTSGNPDQFDFGIHKRANTGASVAAVTGLAEGTTYFVVARYLTNAGADQMDLWVNPLNTTFGNNGLIPTASFSSTTGTDTTVDWDTFVFSFPAQTTGFIDELRIGTDWASVTPVPEPSTYAMLVGGLGLLAFLRRRKVS